MLHGGIASEEVGRIDDEEHEHADADESSDGDEDQCASAEGSRVA